MEFIWHYTNNILEVLSNSVLLQVCDFLHGENTTLVWDNEQQVPFAYRKDQWVGFDDERSLKTKVFVYLFDVTSFSVTLIVKQSKAVPLLPCRHQGGMEVKLLFIVDFSSRWG
jgi:hypothetical protein